MGAAKGTFGGIPKHGHEPARARRALLRTAYHEAGHAVVAWRQGVRLHRVTVRKNGDYLGSVRHASTHNADQWYAADDRAQVRFAREIRICYAGALATKRAFPRSKWRLGAAEDYGRAADIILHVYMDERAQYLWSSLLELETDAILEWGWPAVEALVQALLERETLTGREALAVMCEAGKVDVAGSAQ